MFTFIMRLFCLAVLGGIAYLAYDYIRYNRKGNS